MKTVFTLTVVILFLTSCATPTQVSLDTEIKRLCAIDGGIKTYETVKLPAERFGTTGLINFYRPVEGENALGSDYILKSSRHWISKSGLGTSDAKLSRVHVTIARRSDGRVLSEMIIYQRAGGDAPGPWFPSTYSCPAIPGGEHALLRSTFVKQD